MTIEIRRSSRLWLGLTLLAMAATSMPDPSKAGFWRNLTHGGELVHGAPEREMAPPVRGYKRDVHGVSTGLDMTVAVINARKAGGVCTSWQTPCEGDEDPICVQTLSHCVWDDKSALDVKSTRYASPPEVYAFRYNFDLGNPSDLKDMVWDQFHVGMVGGMNLRAPSGEVVEADCVEHRCFVMFTDSKIAKLDVSAMEERKRASTGKPKF